MKKAVMLISAMALLAAVTAFAGLVLAGEPCPWTITEVGVAKHSNGDKMAETFFKGSFPTNIPGSSERPDWYINGVLVGKSLIHAEVRWIPGGSGQFKPGDNIVKVQFSKPPYSGASFQCTISMFTWLAVPDGGQNWYKCD